jgi:hypothetical protein
MAVSQRIPRPADVAQRLARASRRRKLEHDSAFRRVTFSLPRAQAHSKAREFFDRYPKAPYMAEVESWRELPGDVIKFTMRGCRRQTDDCPSSAKPLI